MNQKRKNTKKEIQHAKKNYRVLSKKDPESVAASSMSTLKQPTFRVVAIIAEGVPEANTKQLIAYARSLMLAGGMSNELYNTTVYANDLDLVIQFYKFIANFCRNWQHKYSLYLERRFILGNFPFNDYGSTARTDFEDEFPVLGTRQRIE
ncbi:hypothetical protein K1719_008172 [Acacia pycnantha]|nr:hypothetical protein K1719_008172 [Acacia pycnantha]